MIQGFPDSITWFTRAQVATCLGYNNEKMTMKMTRPPENQIVKYPSLAFYDKAITDMDDNKYGIEVFHRNKINSAWHSVRVYEGNKIYAPDITSAFKSYQSPTDIVGQDKLTLSEAAMYTFIPYKLFLKMKRNEVCLIPYYPMRGTTWFLRYDLDYYLYICYTNKPWSQKLPPKCDYNPENVRKRLQKRYTYKNVYINSDIDNVAGVAGIDIKTVK